MFSNNIYLRFLHKVEWYLKKVPNIIQRINDYSAENKYDLKKMFNMFSNNIYLTHLMIKCLNQDIIVEGIIVSKKN